MLCGVPGVAGWLRTFPGVAPAVEKLKVKKYMYVYFLKRKNSQIKNLEPSEDNVLFFVFKVEVKITANFFNKKLKLKSKNIKILTT